MKGESMEDKYIVDLFLRRDEEAVRLTQIKYKRYCHSIAYNILNNSEDTEECLNDTWLTAWNTIPPAIPTYLGVYVGKITRINALKKFEYLHAEKRSQAKNILDIDELTDFLPNSINIEEDLIDKDTVKCIEDFLRSISERDRNMFLQRYYYFYSVADISLHHGVKPNYVRTVLQRIRNKLKLYLKERGYNYEN